MKRIAVLIILLSAAELLCAQGNNNNGNGNNGGGNDTFVQHRNLRVNKNLYVLQNTELSGQLRVDGLSFFNNRVSIGSTTSPTETLDIFGNLKTRGTVFAENLNVEFSAEFGEDLTVGRDLFVGRYGYFDRVGIGITGTPTESLDVGGNIKASDKLLSNSVETTLGTVAETWDIGGALTVGGTASFSSDAIIDGLVGIGVASPTEKLEVSGNIKATQALLSQSVTTSELSSETAAISSTLDVEGVTTLNNNLDVSGNQTLGGTLDVTGVSSFNTEVNIGGNTLISGNVGIGNTAPSEKLDVTGNAKVSQTLTANTINTQQANADALDVTNTLNVGGATTLKDQLNVSGTTTIGGSLGVGVATPAKKLDVAGDGQVSGAFSANSISSETFSTSDLEVSNTLTVDGLTTLNDNLNLGGTASIGGNALVDGNLGVGTSTPGEKLDVAGNANISQTLTANSISTQSFSSENIDVTNALSVGGATTLSGNLSVAGTSTLSGNLGLGVASPVEKLEVAGNAKVSQTLTANTINADEFSSENLQVTNTLSVGGATTLGGNLSVAGTSTMSGNLGLGVTNPTEKLEVAGNATVSQTLTAGTINSGNFTSDDLEVSNTLTVGGATSLGGDLSVAGTSTFDGNLGLGVASPTEKLEIAGNMKVTQNATIENNATVNNNLTVNGKVGIGKVPSVALDIDGDLHITGQVQAGDLSISDVTLNNATVNQNLNVSGNASITGDLSSSNLSAKNLTVSQSIALSNLQAGEDKESFLVVDASGNVYSRSLESFQQVGGEETNVAIADQTLSVGTDATPSGYTLAVAGNIISNELTIQQPDIWEWPDYVFEKEYVLLSLEQLEKFIAKNKHLPEVPSAKDVKEEGVQVAEMNATLLKKIEELTLHIIDQNKRIEELETGHKSEVPDIIPTQSEKKIEELMLHMIEQQKQIEVLKAQVKKLSE